MCGLTMSLGRKRLLLIILLCIFIGASSVFYLIYAAVLPSFPRREVKPLVVVLRIEGPILSSDVTRAYVEEIREALRNDSMKAVVLVIDSPGGEVTQIEHIYMELLELKRVKPLVASAIRALSGGYYIAVASDYIYALPSFRVGNIGVIAQWPQAQPLSEQVLESGVYKMSGMSVLSFPMEIKVVLDNFVSAVKLGRGDRLKLPDAELRRAKVYSGVEAVSLGLVDEIGSPQRAVEKAASMAGLTEYDVVELSRGAEAAMESMRSALNSSQQAWNTLDLRALSIMNPPPAIYYLYLPPEKLEMNVERDRARDIIENVMRVGGGKSILMDASHGNRITWLELEVLAWELVRRNMTVEFVGDWRELRERLRNTTALIIALPMTSYSRGEIEDVKRFVGDGGILVLLYDPATEYSRSPEYIKAINSIANAFGMSYASGYLYNEEQHYGVYRNIYVTEFADNALTRNIGALILFTATHIRSDDYGVAWPPESTYSSQSEKPGRYSVIALSRSNGTVIAIGDVTFLTEPYCYLEDNYNLIVNLAEYMASGGRS